MFEEHVFVPQSGYAIIDNQLTERTGTEFEELNTVTKAIVHSQ